MNGARRFWITVASAEHVRLGRARGFMQVCHGKRRPLLRLAPGDGVVYYSPTEAFGGKDRLRSFTAIGDVKPGEPYQVDMGGGFHPFRRDVRWHDAQETPIRPLLAQLAWTASDGNWGYKLRFGLFEIGAADFQTISNAMAASDAMTA